MQFTLTTDYAIRAVLFIAASPHRRVRAAEIAAGMKISPAYLKAILPELCARNILASHLGQDGGYSLGRSAGEISMWDIAAATEGTMNLNRCLEEDAYCSRFATLDCPVRKFYVQLQTHLESCLKACTIKSLLEVPAQETPHFTGEYSAEGGM